MTEPRNTHTNRVREREGEREKERQKKRKQQKPNKEETTSMQTTCMLLSERWDSRPIRPQVYSVWLKYNDSAIVCRSWTKQIVAHLYKNSENVQNTFRKFSVLLFFSVMLRNTNAPLYEYQQLYGVKLLVQRYSILCLFFFLCFSFIIFLLAFHFRFDYTCANNFEWFHWLTNIVSLRPLRSGVDYSILTRWRTALCEMLYQKMFTTSAMNEERII